MARLGRRQPKRAFITRAAVEIGPDVQLPTVVVVRAVELPWASPTLFVERAYADPSIAPPDHNPAPLVVSAQQLLPQQPFVFADRTPVEAARPNNPVVVAVQPHPLTLPFVSVSATHAEPPVAPSVLTRPTVVSAIQPPQQQSFVTVAHVQVDPPAAAPSVLNRPTIVSAIQPPPATWRLADSIEARGAQTAPAAPTELPPKSTIVSAIQPPPATWRLADAIEARGVQAAPDITVPHPVVARTQDPPPPAESAVILWMVVGSAAVTRPAITVVAAGPVPQALPFSRVVRTSVPPVPQPPVPVEATIVGSQPPPPMAGWHVIHRPRVFAAAPVVGEPPPRPSITTYSSPPAEYGSADVGWTVVSDSPPPVRPIVVNGQPWPPQVQSPTVVRQRVDLAPQPPVPIKPTVVSAQQWQPFVQSPWVSQTEVDPPKVPVWPVIVQQQPTPPQMPFIQTKAFTFGSPPPVLRIITPQVNTDMSLPFRPNGRVRIQHGFAEALPQLYQGDLTGGVLAGSSIGGGIGDGAGLTGQRQFGYVTGGVR